SKAKRGSVRFSPSDSTAGSHVRFEEQLHDSAVTVTQEGDGSFLVKVGFLKILHKYEITFLLPPLQRLGRGLSAATLPSPNLHLIGVTPLPEGYSVKCQYAAHREGVIHEELLLTSDTSAATVRIVVQARVMGK
ncbi:CT027 protein, partial [Rhinopomastus cyanomelas]|nr:CT027 protein [Rhinopomastus cyanomelas]